MVNYYDILEVGYEVSIEELKHSFRSLIKKYHPDIHSSNKPWAESKTKTIIQAYKILSDATTRKHYDQLHRHHFQHRKTTKTHKKEDATTKEELIKAKVKSIFTDLLNGHTHNAIENYEHLLKEFTHVDCFLHLNHRDYIDCKFLLAEAYEKLKEYETAARFYELILEKGKNAVHRGHLFDEIKERIRNIYCRKLTKNVEPEKALDYYEKVLTLNLCKSENAFIHKKMAECYLILNAYEKAIDHLNMAISLKPNIQGAGKLKTKLKQYIPDFVL
ncbi:MAG TPA: J domain-containing protein [Candidatus Brocadiaceae bacterium]